MIRRGGSGGGGDADEGFDLMVWTAPAHRHRCAKLVAVGDSDGARGAARTASKTDRPCETRTSTCRSFATIGHLQKPSRHADRRLIH